MKVRVRLSLNSNAPGGWLGQTCRLPGLFFVFLLLWTFAGSFEIQAAQRFFDFGETKPGQIPAGFRPALTGKGKPAEWQVLYDEVPTTLAPLSPNASKTSRRSVLAQVSKDPTDERFPLLILDDEVFADFTFTTRFKTVSGVIEQMAGIAFRIQNETNYYVARASSLGNNLRFYKFVDGVRSDPIGPEIPIPSDTWHELEIQCTGNQIRIRLNGKEAMPTLSDYSFAQGKIGFWTKSDSVSYFLDARMDYVPVEILARKMIRSAMTEYPRLLGLRLYGTTPGRPEVHVIASSDPQHLGKAGGKPEKDVFEKGVFYQGKDGNKVIATLPVRDRNGEPAAALRVEMRAFPGQTEHNVLVRAMPIAKRMESQIQLAKDLVE